MSETTAEKSQIHQQRKAAMISLLTVLTALLASAAAAWLLVKYTRGFGYDAKALDKIPGPSSLPVLGNALDLAVDNSQVLDVSILCGH